jgi:hypothetical protein
MPDLAGTWLASALSSVVLPEPEGPISASSLQGGGRGGVGFKLLNTVVSCACMALTTLPGVTPAEPEASGPLGGHQRQQSARGEQGLQGSVTLFHVCAWQALFRTADPEEPIRDSSL